MDILLDRGNFILIYYHDDRKSASKTEHILRERFEICPEIAWAVKEMVKNIYDHSDTKEGFLSLNISNSKNFSLKVWDTSKKPVDLNKKWIKKNDFNFGVGVGMIKDLKKNSESWNLYISLETHTFHGVFYNLIVENC